MNKNCKQTGDVVKSSGISAAAVSAHTRTDPLHELYEFLLTVDF